MLINSTFSGLKRKVLSGSLQVVPISLSRTILHALREGFNIELDCSTTARHLTSISVWDLLCSFLCMRFSTVSLRFRAELGSAQKNTATISHHLYYHFYSILLSSWRIQANYSENIKNRKYSSPKQGQEIKILFCLKSISKKGLGSVA